MTGGDERLNRQNKVPESPYIYTMLDPDLVIHLARALKLTGIQLAVN